MIQETKRVLRLRPRRRRIQCFPTAEAGRLGLNMLPARLRPIDVSKIVGTVDRCGTLTPTFLPKKEGERSARFRSVLRAMQGDVVLPPIEVYQLRREYYVVDGHHRVAAAIKLDVAYLDAYVHTVVFPDTTYENRLNNRRVLFAQRTGLQHVELGAPEDYVYALKVIDAFAAMRETESLTYEEAARRWYSRVYQPFTRRIASSGIMDHFPGEAPGYILLQLYEHAERERKARGHDVDLEDALSDFETRYPPISGGFLTTGPLASGAHALGAVSRTVAQALPSSRRKGQQ